MSAAIDPPGRGFWRSAALPFVEARYARDSAACYLPHSHATFSVGAVDGGSSTFLFDGQRRRLEAGDVVLIPHQAVHSCNPERGGAWSYQMLYLDVDWLCAVVGELQPCSAEQLGRIVPDGGRKRYGDLSRLSARCFGQGTDEDKEAALTLFVGRLFAPLAALQAPAAAPSVQGRLREVRALISERCAETLTLQSLAAAAGLSRYHFVRAFRRAFGMTPHAWQTDQRVGRARTLIAHGVPLAEAAAQLGFSDQSHFQRAFKSRVAATPGEYRRRAAPGCAISFKT